MNTLPALKPTETRLVPAPVDAPPDIGGLMQLAIEKNLNVESMERLLAMRRELRAEHAKTLYDEALAAFQAACPIISKTKAGPSGAYKFAPLETIVAETKELIRQYGFSYRITSEISEGWVQALCTLTHSGGHSETTQFKVPVDSRNKMMSDPQRYAGSLTFATRYAFRNALGILTGDEDRDGTNTLPKPPGPSSLGRGNAIDARLKKRLVDLLRSVHGIAQGYALDERAKDAMSQWLWDEGCMEIEMTLEDLTGDKLAKALAKVEAKLS